MTIVSIVKDNSTTHYKEFTMMGWCSVYT